MLAAVTEQRRLLRCADQPCRQRTRHKPALLIDLAEMRHRLLDHAPTHPDAAHQRPVAMDLAVLLACRVAQVHAPSESNSPAEGNSLGRHDMRKSAADCLQLIDLTRRASAKLAKSPASCASWATVK